MNPEHWQKVKALFDAVIELAPKERERMLDKSCGNDAQLRRDVEKLLDSFKNATSFMEQPAASEVADEILEKDKLPNGIRLGHYEIIKHIGAGGMGEVYLAKDAKLKRQVALKVLPAEFINNHEHLRRFEQEAFAASALNHPNILTIYEIGEEDDVHFIAAEYVEGETLRERVRREPLNLKSVLDVALQITGALQAAHSAGIVHRDLKPDNVMIRPDGLAKLLDFGIAKLTEKKIELIDAEAETAIRAHTKTGALIGTAAYMSPEQARGKAVDARSDIFSFGLVLYEMLSGKMAFEGENALDVISLILHKEPLPLSRHKPDVPREIERIVNKALKKDCEERYQTAKDLLIDLKDARQELEFQNKLERSFAPDRGQAETQIISPATTDAARAASTSEYITAEIKHHKLGFLALSVLLLAAAGFGSWFFASRVAHATPIESIAVLPFVNESGNADAEYLSDGMTESLINSLSQIPKLNVKARNSVFRYKGKEDAIQKIGQELNVQAVLNGRVVQRGNELTLYLSLEDVQTGNRIWGGQYNRKLINLVALQTEISGDVSNKLRVKLSGADEQRVAKQYTANPKAYQLYLQGRHHWNKRTGQDLQKALGYFEQAIALDPNYALAYTGLADTYALLSNYGSAPPPPRETKPKARAAALKALSLDDQLAEAHAALGLILTEYDYDFAAAEREYKRAIELNPNYATTHQFYGELLTHLGRHEEASAALRRALEIDPLSLVINRIYGGSLFYARRYDEAVTQLTKTIELDANFASARGTLSIVYQSKGNYAASSEEFAKFLELTGRPEEATAVRESFAQGGWEGFLRILTDEPRPIYFAPYVIATFYAQLGEKDRAFAELNKSYEKRESYMILLKVDPRLDALRSDPRFQDLLRRVGLEQ